MERDSKAGQVGRPALPSTRWLAQRLRPGQPASRLYRGWLEQYQRVTGCTPADPGGSFRAAVRVARQLGR